MQTTYGAGRAALTPIPPATPLVGHARPPGSKSITNRALLVASLAQGTSHLTGALKSVDTELMAAALRQMGVDIAEPDDTSFVVRGTGQLNAPEKPLFLGNAGTATRFLTAATATANGKVVVDGDAHMRQRPIGALVDALRALQVDITSANGFPPVTVNGQGQLGGGRVEIDGSLSSQFVSALLMAAPKSARPVEICLTGDDIGARGYIDLTLAVMRAFGAEINHTSGETSSASWQVATGGYRPHDLAIEPDASAATYLWAAEALTNGNIDLGLSPGDFTQPDAAAHALIAKFPNMPPEINGSQMQDAIPTLAVLAAFNNAPVRFTGIENLRVKECDRITALATGLANVAPGLGREEGDDLIVTPAALAPVRAGKAAQSPVKIETYNDHRIAMSFALAGLKLPGITILNPDCTAKTFPTYWDVLAGLGVKYQ